jgi:uncharacterized membrane protein YbaN (DUF454 family)
MRKAVRRIVILTLGWMFILIGIIGLFLPILQGFLFFGIGLALLSKESAWVRARIAWARKRWPRLAAMMDRTEAKAAEFAQRIFRRGPKTG